MMGYGWGMGPWGWMFMGLFWILIVGLVVWAVVALLPRTRTHGGGWTGPVGPYGGPGAPVAGPGPGRPETAEEILDRRFALGEIDAEQYRAARAELAAARRASQ